MKNKGELLSALWIFVTFNYLYCDLIGLMDARLLRQYLQGFVQGMTIDESFLLYAGILMEIPISMIVLSKILRPKASAWSNMVAGSIKTIVMVATLFMGKPTQYYQFFAIIEIATTICIVCYAATWLAEKEQVPTT